MDAESTDGFERFIRELHRASMGDSEFPFTLPKSSYAEPAANRRILVDKTRQRVRFENESETEVIIVIEPK